MDAESRILIIDDEEVVLDSCTQILNGSGVDIATAMDGTRGLMLVQEFHPDLVVVDLKMPGLSGFEVLEKTMALDPTIVPIVITGYATVSSAVEAMKRGAYDFLPKPFTPDEFRLIIRRGLEKRRLVLETIALRREREMLRENFAAIVSHELKTPLSAIQQNLFAMEAELERHLGDAQKNRLERMKSRVDDLLKLIHTWLQVITADTEKLKETFEPVSVVTVITKAVESIQPQAVRMDVEIVTSIGEPLSPVYGHEGSLVQAVLNILSNAVKYCHAGSQVRVGVEEAASTIRLCVEDSGVGISKEDLPFIFNDFYRGKSGQVVDRGCGLGLAITRRIIEAHQGSISVESEPGKGSTFVISVPALKLDAATQSPLNAPVMANSQKGGVG